MRVSSTLDPHGCPYWVIRQGFRYNLLLSNARMCLYQQTDDERHEIVGYEVFHIKWQNERRINGVFLKRRFQFPHDEAFGYWAWSFGKFKCALEKVTPSRR
jgi:hypothetical protein